MIGERLRAPVALSVTPCHSLSLSVTAIRVPGVHETSPQVHVKEGFIRGVRGTPGPHRLNSLFMISSEREFSRGMSYLVICRDVHMFTHQTLECTSAPLSEQHVLKNQLAVLCILRFSTE